MTSTTYLLSEQPTKLISTLGQALLKKLAAKIEDPLPLYPTRPRLPINCNPLPRFATNAAFQEALGQINGRPAREVFETERDLHTHLHKAFKTRRLVYCKQQLELDPETNEIINDPIKNLVPIAKL